MSNNKNYIKLFLFLSFGIAWVSEILLFFLYNLNTSVVQIFHFIIIGFGAGMAPAYAAFIVEKKYNEITLKSFLKIIVHTKNFKLAFTTLVLFALIQYYSCVMQENYLDNPLYYFILYMPLMILGGGLEEVGWNGIFNHSLKSTFHICCLL